MKVAEVCITVAAWAVIVASRLAEMKLVVEVKPGQAQVHPVD